MSDSPPSTDAELTEESTRKDAVEAELRKVRDPDADVNVFEAGLVEEIRLSGGDVTIAADLEEFGPSDGQQISATMMRAATSVEGVERAHVEHASQSTADDRSAGVAGIDRVIAVASAKGGVGKSTVATTLACALAGDEDHAVGLFDADIHGPNVPDLLDVSGPIHSDEDGRPLPVETRGLEVMSVGLMQDGAPLAWRGAMAHDALTELFEETAWADRDTLVVDLPPGTGDVVLTTLQEVPIDGVVVVTTPFHAAVTDTGRSLELFRENEIPVLGVVANMGSFACPSCGDEHDLFPDGSPLDDLDAPVLAHVPFDHAMQGTPAPGDVPDAVADLGVRVRDRLAEIWDVTVPDHAVDLRDVPPEHRRDRVREAFESLETGDPFAVVSDRDPSPVRPFLAELAGVEPEAVDPFRVRQQNPDVWHLETERP
jgi:ATP-binding protein involved in chromosome partitioning